jgi:hypothetical protein
MTRIKIAVDFSATPGTRYVKDGSDSGEKFREEVLIPRYRESNGADLVIELDGVEGYPASFLEEAFGGFARQFGRDVALTRLRFVSNDSSLIQEIQEYIRDA